MLSLLRLSEELSKWRQRRVHAEVDEDSPLRRKVSSRAHLLQHPQGQEADDAVEEVLSSFSLETDALRALMKRMDELMTTGLESNDPDSSIKMLPSFVPSLPDGKEEGSFLALDLGGTNLRVLLLKLEKGKCVDMQQNKFRMPNDLKIGPGENLFDFMAEKIHLFLKERDMEDCDLALGFTFSFPCQQTKLCEAKLVSWTKGFNAAGVVGEDVGGLLQDAIDRRQRLRVRVAAVLNDTIGTEVATAADENGCDLGAVVGTGTNCAYVEEAAKILKLKGSGYGHSHMLINTEWGGFGDGADAAEVQNKYDRAVDDASVHPGSYTFDKLVGGMYLGETVRLVLLDLMQRGLIFTAVPRSEKRFSFLHSPLALETRFISEMLSEDCAEGRRSHVAARRVLEALGLHSRISFADVLLTLEVASVVARRSAHLAAAALACVVLRTGKRSVTIGMDGTTYKKIPFYDRWCQDKLRELLPESIKFRVVQAGDGSGKGAALVVAIAHRYGMN